MNEPTTPGKQEALESAENAIAAPISISQDHSPERHPLEAVTGDFLTSLKNLGQTMRIVVPHLAKWLHEEKVKEAKKLQFFIPEDKKKEKSAEIKLQSARDFVELVATLTRLDELRDNKALPVLFTSLFTQLFSEFDAFTVSLLRIIYTRNATLLKGISREISLSELLEYDDLEAAKRSILEKEIETFRRDGYVEQFASLERKFGLQLRKFSEWGEFVELGQRRNLFVHNNGCVNDQYLLVCDKEAHRFATRPKVGVTLEINGAYFARALTLMSKVAFMLSHTLWSKIFPKEVDELHESMNSILYKTLVNKRWKLGAELADFTLLEPMKKNCSELLLKIRIINSAIALKFSGDEIACGKLLASYDWSASYRDFRLAILILEDKFDEAIRVMESIGKVGEILTQPGYHSWPLFHKFRERPEFYAVYEKIYGEPYQADLPAEENAGRTSVAVSTSEPPSKMVVPFQDAKPVAKRTRRRAKNLADEH